MKMRLSVGTLLFTLLSFALPYAAFAGIPYFGTIIPGGAAATCPAGWGMIIVVINNIMSWLITIVIVFIAPIMIAYAGFLFVVNPVNSGGISKAKGVLLNTVVGLVVALIGYLVVDAVMGSFYNGDWKSIIRWNGSQCLNQSGSQPGAGLNQAASPGVTAGGGGGGGNVNLGSLAQCSTSNTYCNPSALQAAGMTPSQANVMSCIAVTESSGDPNTPPYNQTHPSSNSSACGLFQITQTTWRNNASAGCANFSSSCMDAACNTQTAAALVARNGYSDWTCANCNNKAAGCIEKYGG
jgi:hypothetical protein